MRAISIKSIVGAAVVAAVVAVPAASVDAAPPSTGNTVGVDDDLTIIGLAGNGTRLYRFDESNTRPLESLGAVQNLVGDTFLIGIDYRVQNGTLYGVGDRGGIYKIALLRYAEGPRAMKVGKLDVALAGTRFGVDFNPAANRLRVVSDTGQNLRHNIDDPLAPKVTTVDGTLTYPPLTTPATGITGAAYTNNDLDPDTSTTLFDLDTALDQIAVQSPANNGTLAATGKLGADVELDAGFDIYSTVRNGTTVDVEGYAVVKLPDMPYALYEVDILTGRVTFEGDFGRRVTDLAIPLGQR